MPVSPRPASQYVHSAKQIFAVFSSQSESDYQPCSVFTLVSYSIFFYDYMKPCQRNDNYRSFDRGINDAGFKMFNLAQLFFKTRQDIILGFRFIVS